MEGFSGFAEFVGVGSRGSRLSERENMLKGGTLQGEDKRETILVAKVPFIINSKMSIAVREGLRIITIVPGRVWKRNLIVRSAQNRGPRKV